MPRSLVEICTESEFIFTNHYSAPRLSWYFGKTPGAPPLQIKGLRIDKEEQEDA